MTGGESFEKIKKLVDDGAVELVFVLGLPRGGTTALEKYVYEKMNFTGQINEPSLLGPPPAGESVSRIEGTFCRVYDHVRGGGIFLVKEVTNKVLPEMIPLWSRLVSTWLVVVRNPLLQLESRLKCMLDRIESGALKDLGIEADAHNLHVHGYPCFLDDEEEQDMRWSTVYTTMKKERDFSRLGYGALRACLLHPFCQWPECQRVLWQRQAEKDALPLADFHTLSQDQAAAIVDWRLGWSPLCRQLELLFGLVSKARLRIIDFSDVQADGGAAVLKYLKTKAKMRYRKKNTDYIPFETCANKGDWNQEKWQQWYAAPCFDKAEKSVNIESAKKAPMPLAHFPRFLSKDTIPNAVAFWLELLNGPYALSSPNIATTIDPIHTACCTMRRTRKELTKGEYKDLARKIFFPEDKRRLRAGTTACLLVAIAQCISILQCFLAWILTPKKYKLKTTPTTDIGDTTILSIIIPALNEAHNIAETVAAVYTRAKSSARIEVILVDAASSDDTVRIAQETAQKFQQKIFIIHTEKKAGRGKALRLGADLARGRCLFFLHADTLPPYAYDTAIENALADPSILISAFRFSFQTTSKTEQNSLVLRLVAACTNFRSSQLRLPLGDQGLALTKSSLSALRGFDEDHPMMEDAALVLRARSVSFHAVTTLKSYVYTSPRRFLHRPISSNLANAFFLFSYHLGWVKPEAIFRAYYQDNSL